MAWSYADYEAQGSDDARLARLRLHIAEVAEKQAAANAGDGRSRDPSNLTRYMELLYRRLDALEQATGAEATAPRTNSIRFNG